MGAHLTKSNLVRGERRKGHHYAGTVRTLYVQSVQLSHQHECCCKVPSKMEEEGEGDRKDMIYSWVEMEVTGKEGGGEKRKGKGQWRKEGLISFSLHSF